MAISPVTGALLFLGTIMNQFPYKSRWAALGLATTASALGCAASHDPAPDLARRAYIIARDSDDLTVIDLDRLEIIGQVHTAGIANHMAELNADFTKLYVDSESTNESIVVDAVLLQVVRRIPTGASPTHVSLSRDGNLLAVVNEYGDSVSFIDPVRDVEIKRLGGFSTPHFVRFSPDGHTGYVANIGAFHLTRVDLGALEITDHIALDGYAGPPDATLAPFET